MGVKRLLEVQEVKERVTKFKFVAFAYFAKDVRRCV